MRRQLNLLRKDMYRGYYALDSFKGNLQAGNRNVCQYSFTLSKFCPLKRHLISSADAGAAPRVKDLEQVSRNLRNMIEFMVFLKNYSPLYRQPYSMHLIIDNCMFGRQMEMERVISFLLQGEPCNGENIGVLPIIGSAGVGKSTLVAHVYNNEKVRDHFSRIELVNEDDLTDKRLTSLQGGGVTIYQNNNQLHRGKGRFLIIVELSEDVDEATWKTLYEAYAACCLESGSKILVTSRSDKIINFGATRALVLNFLPVEAYWYFFKVLTFGSANPEYRQTKESIAFEISRELNGSFGQARIMSSLLRNNSDAQYWLGLLAGVRKYPQKQSTSSLSYNGLKPQYFRIGYHYFVIYREYQKKFHHRPRMIPKITLQDVLFGRVKCQRRFEIVAWKSQLPPYGSYIYNCALRKPSKLLSSKAIILQCFRDAIILQEFIIHEISHRKNLQEQLTMIEVLHAIMYE